MKKEIVYITIIGLGLFLSSGIVMAQSGNEIAFNLMNIPSNNDTNLLTVRNNDTHLVTINAAVNARQSVSDDGIHFSLIIRNNTGEAITIKNIGDQLMVSLYDTSGLDVAIPNINIVDCKRYYPHNWEFRSKSVIPEKIYINGKEENNDPKKQEYIKIPGGGNCKTDLIIKNVIRVGTPKDVCDQIPEPTGNVAPGKYKLQMFFYNITNVPTKPGGVFSILKSPMIDINYSN